MAAVAIGIVGCAVIAGLIVSGSPAEQRVRRLDDDRVRDLRGIADAVNAFAKARGRLPDSLDELSGGPTATVRTRDAATGEPYAFRQTGPMAFELCARFEREALEGSSYWVNRFWSHGPGRQCFQLDAETVPSGPERP
jgi:hypothetical protein